MYIKNPFTLFAFICAVFDFLKGNLQSKEIKSNNRISLSK